MKKDCATNAYLPTSRRTSWSNSTSPLLVVEARPRLLPSSLTTAAGAPRPSLLSLGVDLPSQVSCGSRACALIITAQALICERLQLALPLLRRNTRTRGECVPGQVRVAYLQRQPICSLHGADSQRGGQSSLIARNLTRYHAVYPLPGRRAGLSSLWTLDQGLHMM